MMKQLTTLVMAGALMLQAQGPVGPPPQGPRPAGAVKDYLGLTEDQITQLNDLRRAERQANQAVFEQLAGKQKSLRELLQGGSSDAAAIGKLQLEIETLRKQLEQSRARLRDQARAVLNASQQAKLKTLEEAAALQPAIAGAGALNLLDMPGPWGGMMGGGPGSGFGGRRQPAMR